MNLKGLRLFRGVVATGSLSVAAEQLNLSASAASRLLSQLESQLSLDLFSRSRRSLELTEEGMLFYQRISTTLAGIEAIPKIAREIRSSTRQRLSIVASAPMASGLVVPTVAWLRDQGADLQCTVHIENRFEIECKVANAVYDMGVIALPVANEIIPLDVEPLLRGRLSVLMPDTYPLAAHAEIDLKQAAEQPLIIIPRSPRWSRWIEEMTHAIGRPPQIAHEAASLSVSVEMVRHQLGVTLVDGAVLSPDILHGLTLRPLTGERWIQYASIHASGPRSEQCRLFHQALVSFVAARRASNPMIAGLVELG